MTAKQNEESSPAQLTFEEALAQLEAIVAELEEGRTPLAEGLAHYERGVKLLRQCYQQLEDVERRIEVLNRVDSEGRAHCEPFDDDALSLDEKVRLRGRRRTRSDNSDPGSAPNDMDGPGRLF
jgi:exodeoxyribonuclease VII small subunit